MFNKALKTQLRNCQIRLVEAERSAGVWREEAESLSQLYGKKQKEANERATRLPNFIYGLAKHEASLVCLKPTYHTQGYRFRVLFQPRLHIPGEVHRPLELDEKTLNLLNNLMESIGIGSWDWVKETACLAKTYYALEDLPNAPSDMGKAEAELQALLDEAVRLQKIVACEVEKRNRQLRLLLRLLKREGEVNEG